MVEIDKQFSEAGMSSPSVVHQRTTYSHRNRNRIRTTPICQNRPVVRTSRTNTDSPAGCIISERGEGGVEPRQAGEQGVLRLPARNEAACRCRARWVLYTLAGPEMEMIITRVRHRTQLSYIIL